MNNVKDNQSIGEKEKKKKQLPDYYQWVIVGLCFLMVMAALGFSSSPKSLFIGPICEALGIDRSMYSINDSLRYITTSITNLFFGFLIMKLGEKKLILAGFLSLVSSALCYAFAPNVWMLYLGGILLGLGLSWTTTTMVGYVVNKWSKRNKGTIMGAVLAANGIGGAIAIEIVGPIIESKGHRSAYIVIAAVLAAVAVILAIFFRRKREAEGETSAPAKKKARGEGWVGIEFSELKKKWYFYGAMVAIFLTGMILMGVGGVAAQHMKDVGIDPAFVTRVMSIHSLTLAFFKFGTGFLYDRLGLRVTVTVCSVTSILVMLAMVFVSDSAVGMALALFYGVFVSLALPLETIMLPIYASDLFGERSYGKTLGLVVSVNTAGYALGAFMMNLCCDLTGSYRTSFIISICLMALTITLLQLVITAANKEKRRIIAEYNNENK